MTPKPVVLWSTPRSVSTAFDKMMRERGDHRVLTEPFSVAYYFGPDRPSDRFAGETLPRSSYADVWGDVLAAAARSPVFVKEMPHHLGPHLTAATVARFTNTFLIRDPARAVPSFLGRWPDVTDEELGYEAQHRAFDLVTGVGGAPPVIDADDLCADPGAVVAAWCEAVAIEHRPDTLTWRAGMPDDWRLWADWFVRAAASSGRRRRRGRGPAQPSTERRSESRAVSTSTLSVCSSRSSAARAGASRSSRLVSAASAA
jgi:hypothetical protein